MIVAGERRLDVLVADDDYLVCEEVVRAVEAGGHRVVARASNGRAAIELLRSTRPHVAVLDIEMPEVGGLEAARRITATCPIPIVILSAYDNPDLLREATNTGIGAYLTKPPDAGEIERAIWVAVARHEDLMKCRRLREQLNQRNHELEDTNRRLREVLGEVRELREIVPICAYCKKIRNDTGYWEQVEVYMERQGDVRFSHGICPECRTRVERDMRQRGGTGNSDSSANSNLQ